MEVVGLGELDSYPVEADIPLGVLGIHPEVAGILFVVVDNRLEEVGIHPVGADILLVEVGIRPAGADTLLAEFDSRPEEPGEPDIHFGDCLAAHPLVAVVDFEPSVEGSPMSKVLPRQPLQ